MCFPSAISLLQVFIGEMVRPSQGDRCSLVTLRYTIILLLLLPAKTCECHLFLRASGRTSMATFRISGYHFSVVCPCSVVIRLQLEILLPSCNANLGAMESTFALFSNGRFFRFGGPSPKCRRVDRLLRDSCFHQRIAKVNPKSACLKIFLLDWEIHLLSVCTKSIIFQKLVGLELPIKHSP